MNLTANFTLAEMVSSQTAARLGIDNAPTPEFITNLQRVAQVLEQIRALLNCPILISSGYRCAALNERVGGSKTSAHMRGMAADFTSPKFGTPFEVARRIQQTGAIGFDQLIHEYGAWVHIGIADNAPRHQTLSIFNGTGYFPGIWANRQSAELGR